MFNDILMYNQKLSFPSRYHIVILKKFIPSTDLGAHKEVAKVLWHVILFPMKLRLRIS